MVFPSILELNTNLLPASFMVRIFIKFSPLKADFCTVFSLGRGSLVSFDVREHIEKPTHTLCVVTHKGANTQTINLF